MTATCINVQQCNVSISPRNEVGKDRVTCYEHLRLRVTKLEKKLTVTADWLPMNKHWTLQIAEVKTAFKK